MMAATGGDDGRDSSGPGDNGADGPLGSEVSGGGLAVRGNVEQRPDRKVPLRIRVRRCHSDELRLLQVGRRRVVEVDMRPRCVRVSARPEVRLKHTEDRRQPLLAVQHVVDWVIRVPVRQRNGTEVPLRAQLCLRAPEDQGTERPGANGVAERAPCVVGWPGC